MLTTSTTSYRTSGESDSPENQSASEQNFPRPGYFNPCRRLHSANGLAILVAKRVLLAVDDHETDITHLSIRQQTGTTKKNKALAIA